MPIQNRAKLRPDVLKLMDELQQDQSKGVTEFFQRKENQGIDFSELWGRVMNGNALFFKNRGVNEELKSMVTREEMLFLAGMHRFSSDYAADIEQKKYPIPDDVKIETVDAGPVPAEWQTVPGSEDDRVLIYLHGGGWILGSINDHRLLTLAMGEAAKMRVLSVDYRLAPENPYPAHLEDCTAVYRWLLSTGYKPENIIISGDSAGGSLTLTTLLKLKQDGVDLPAGAVCISPSTDVSFTNDLYFKNGETDPILADLGIFWWIEAYLAGTPVDNPLVSPLFGDLKGLPPLLIQMSSCEMLFEEGRQFGEKARAAGVDVTLEIWDDMPHVFQGFGLHDLPEAKEAITKIGEFARNRFN